MLNTEKLKAIQHIRNAQEVVTKALDKPGLNGTQRRILDDLSDYLRDLDTFLVMSELSDCIDQLKEKFKRLKALNARTKKQEDKLKEVSKSINLVANVIGGLSGAAVVLNKYGLV